MRWGHHFGVTRSPSEAGLTRPLQRRPIHTPPSLPPSAVGARRGCQAVEPTAASRAYDAAVARNQGTDMTWRWAGGNPNPRSEAGGRAASEASGGSGRSHRSERSAAVRSAATGATGRSGVSGLSGLSRATGASAVPSVRAVSISGSAVERSGLLRERRVELQRQLEQVLGW